MIFDILILHFIFMPNIDDKLLSGNEDAPEQKPEQESEDEPMSLRQRMRAARQAMNLKQKAKDKLEEKIAQSPNKIFIILLFVALMVDLLEFLDFGIFSSLVNLGIYAIAVMTGLIAWFFKNNSNKFSVFNLLKGQIWKYAVIPLFETIPFINVLPFWTGTVVMMWVEAGYKFKKI